MHPRNIKRRREILKKKAKEMRMTCPKCHKDMKLEKDGWHCYRCE